ncbi:hypothetical protein F3Y22_tig00110627pilonHSYRG00093 [Hibiscus syriacus]|uniref:Retrovirus-related Pol polyprotein from transposon TNT 1-94-like beta-barrel domain-containing protein n=1 Tax=Hibiscus syriacus TaxID=106335 RepID=A0A6A2ZZQ7_HIBSY|nr:hypothetical protein F3Y22_tig00110627pilonHSYRG00093 [Hibiscus syriacus]
MIEDHLYCKDLYESIIYKDKVEGRSDAQWELLNRKVVAMIPPEGKLTMDTVSDSLLGEETRRMERGRSKSRSKITCYYCGRMGYKKMECRSFKRDQKAENVKLDQISPTKKQEENSTTTVVSKENMLYLVDEGNILNIAYDDSSWIVDSGASFHVTPHRSFFSSYRSDDFGTVKMGNQYRSKIVGIGDIILTTSTGCKLILKDVRHIPTMRLNLISAGNLDDVGLISYFGERKWKITKRSLIMAREKKEESLNVMQAKLCK